MCKDTTPPRGVPVALVLTISQRLRDSNTSNPKRPENAFVCMCPTVSEFSSSRFGACRPNPVGHGLRKDSAKIAILFGTHK